jgi:hypothetical protein
MNRIVFNPDGAVAQPSIGRDQKIAELQRTEKRIGQEALNEDDEGLWPGRRRMIPADRVSFRSRRTFAGATYDAGHSGSTYA